MLLEFPCELVSALVAGRLSARGRAFDPFLRGYLLRLLVAGILTGLVSWPLLQFQGCILRCLCIGWL